MWKWSPEAYYDGNDPPRFWAKWKKEEMIPYEEFRERVPEAARLNSQN